MFVRARRAIRERTLISNSLSRTRDTTPSPSRVPERSPEFQDVGKLEQGSTRVGSSRRQGAPPPFGSEFDPPPFTSGLPGTMEASKTFSKMSRTGRAQLKASHALPRAIVSFPLFRTLHLDAERPLPLESILEDD